MTASENGINFIKKRESCRLTSYQDIAGIWTIGWGSIMYKSGKRVSKGETITQAEADDLLLWEVGNKSAVISALVPASLNQNQFDAILSFTYNEGVGAFSGSTLLKVIKKNPCDPYIRDCFAMWDKITVDGKKVVSSGLVERRKLEADLYFT
jgi:lysozyme